MQVSFNHFPNLALLSSTTVATSKDSELFLRIPTLKLLLNRITVFNMLK